MFAVFVVISFGDHLPAGPRRAVVVLVAFLRVVLAIRTSARLTRSVSWWAGGSRPRAACTSTTSCSASCCCCLPASFAFAARSTRPGGILVAIGLASPPASRSTSSPSVRLEDVYWAN